MAAPAAKLDKVPSGQGRRTAAGSFRKYLFLLTYVCCFGALGCAARAPVDVSSARIAELETQNADLESQLTALREERLGQQRGCRSGAKKTEHIEVVATESSPDGAVLAKIEPGQESTSADVASSSAPQETPSTSSESAKAGPTGRPNLPVVRLSPGSSAPPSRATDPKSTVDQEPAKTPDPDTTRPVLKGRGSQEAWVYHRPVSDQDRASDQAAP